VTNQEPGSFPILFNVMTLSDEMFWAFIHTYPLTSEDWAARYLDRYCSELDRGRENQMA
jgi:hypothetical protein